MDHLALNNIHIELGPTAYWPSEGTAGSDRQYRSEQDYYCPRDSIGPGQIVANPFATDFQLLMPTRNPEYTSPLSHEEIYYTSFYHTLPEISNSGNLEQFVNWGTECDPPEVAHSFPSGQSIGSRLLTQEHTVAGEELPIPALTKSLPFHVLVSDIIWETQKKWDELQFSSGVSTKKTFLRLAADCSSQPRRGFLLDNSSRLTLKDVIQGEQALASYKDLLLDKIGGGDQNKLLKSFETADTVQKNLNILQTALLKGILPRLDSQLGIGLTRATRACDSCHRRKTKCHLPAGSTVCTMCTESGIECANARPVTRRGRKVPLRRQKGSYA